MLINYYLKYDNHFNDLFNEHNSNIFLKLLIYTIEYLSVVFFFFKRTFYFLNFPPKLLIQKSH